MKRAFFRSVSTVMSDSLFCVAVRARPVRSPGRATPRRLRRASAHGARARLSPPVARVKRPVPDDGRHDHLPRAGPATVIFIAGGTVRLPLLTGDSDGLVDRVGLAEDVEH